MNQVKGGWRCFIVTKWGSDGEPNEGYWIDVPGASVNEAAKFVPRLDGAVGFVC